MSRIFKYLILILFLTPLLIEVNTETYSVKVNIEQHLNEVSDKFLSFTLDPKYLFTTSEKYTSKESICMASSLAPAYLRIAGPTTSHISFNNSIITITNLTKEMQNYNEKQQEIEKNDLKKEVEMNGLKKEIEKNDLKKLTITNEQWTKFVYWAKRTGFELVFALNNGEKTESGLWDANSALNILTLAERANVTDIFWQLGYECQNQSIEEYLNDLETLRVIIDTFPREVARGWHVVGGDVTPCLQAASKSDFSDYVTLSIGAMDALMLNGNSSSIELERLSDTEHMQLLNVLNNSRVPLWLTENPMRGKEIERAADWMVSLGYSARNGFAVHYRELMDEELFAPTLSFYMAALFKNLVGERVLNLEMNASQAVLFAHCTSLRHKPVPGAITLYGANMDDEPARFSIKLSRREEGGDILQFILGNDTDGNIIVNKRPMHYEGDIRPVVKRVGPYKTLLINLPPKSFGFWVLANTKVDACHNFDNNNDSKVFSETETINIDNIVTEKPIKLRPKREVSEETDFEDSNIPIVSDDFGKLHTDGVNSVALRARIDNLNKELGTVHKHFSAKRETVEKRLLPKLKRQILSYKGDNGKHKVNKYYGKFNDDSHGGSKMDLRPELIERLLQLTEKLNATRIIRNDRVRKALESIKSRVNVNRKYLVHQDNKNVHHSYKYKKVGKPGLERQRRSIHDNKSKFDAIEFSGESILDNEIDLDNVENFKIEKMLHKIHEQIRNMHPKIIVTDERRDKVKNSEENSGILTKAIKIKDDIKDSASGVFATALENVLSVVGDLNGQLNAAWNALNLIE